MDMPWRVSRRNAECDLAVYGPGVRFATKNEKTKELRLVAEEATKIILLSDQFHVTSCFPQ